MLNSKPSDASSSHCEEHNDDMDQMLLDGLGMYDIHRAKKKIGKARDFDPGRRPAGDLPPATAPHPALPSPVARPVVPPSTVDRRPSPHQRIALRASCAPAARHLRRFEMPAKLCHPVVTCIGDTAPTTATFDVIDSSMNKLLSFWLASRRASSQAVKRAAAPGASNRQ
uniref:Uncharacterized protein n=1 Tax=Oryza meridionalis TaxID=40149 RepID=A0A0E0DAA0_9ORYZ